MKLKIGKAVKRWTKNNDSIIKTEISPDSKKSKIVDGLLALLP